MSKKWIDVQNTPNEKSGDRHRIKPPVDEPSITIKELEKICDKEKAEYMPVGIPQDISPVWNTAILRILTAAKRAARKEK